MYTLCVCVTTTDQIYCTCYYTGDVNFYLMWMLCETGGVFYCLHAVCIASPISPFVCLSNATPHPPSQPVCHISLFPHWSVFLHDCLHHLHMEMTA